MKSFLSLTIKLFKNIKIKYFRRKNNKNWTDFLFHQNCAAFFYKYNRKLINIVLKNCNNNFHEARIFMRNNYLGSYENKKKFAYEYSINNFFLDKPVPFINYRRLANFIFKTEPIYFIKADGQIHIFLKDEYFLYANKIIDTLIKLWRY